MKKRKKLLQAYLENSIEFLNTVFGEENCKNEYIDFVKQTVMEKIQRPTLEVVVHKTYGEADLEKVDLLNFSNGINNKIITPSGSIYETTNNKESLLKKFIEDLLTQRGIVKKKMLNAELAGNKDLALLYKNEQATIKINTNSLIGAMGSPYNCFYDKAGFNSVTSISRQSIMTAYSHTERLLEGNFYFPDNEYILNHLTILKKYCPMHKLITDEIDKFNLYRPEPDDVLDFILSNKSNYTTDDAKGLISRFLNNCKPAELCWFYYYDNLKNLFQTGSDGKNSDYFNKNNNEFFKGFVKDLFDINSIITDIHTKDPFDLFKLDEDLLILMGNVYNNMLEGCNIFKLSSTKPELAKKMFSIGSNMQEKLNKIKPLINLFTNTKINIPEIYDAKNLIRKCVIVSDTDSVLFSTKNWVVWYTGEPKIIKESFEINALMVYLLSKTTEYVLQSSSTAMGAALKDINAVEMKNEFLYPYYLNTILKKHYAGPQTIQEGIVLPVPKKDIKGGNLRGSKLPKITLDYIENFIFDLFDDAASSDKISAQHYILKIIKREQKISNSIKKGEFTFLENTPIKNANEYKNSDQSVFWNYQMWQDIFAPKYGDINIPSKAIVVPVIDSMIRSKEYLEILEKIDKTIADKLKIFLNENKAKKITRIVMNPLLPSVPEEIIPVIHINPIVYANCSSLYLVMRSFSLDIGNAQNKYTFSDIYFQ